MKLRLVFLFLLIACSSFSLLADGGHSHLAPGEKLGNVTFPTSCAAGVQKSFERGVALLHSFEYESAENQFKEVAKQDPGCAMADWGQAMSLYHQLWGRPSKPDMKRGSDLLTHAVALKPKTEREREYISALAAFYRECGRDQASIKLFERSLRIFEKSLGHDNPQTILVRTSLARAYLDGGRYTEAGNIATKY